jgi:hypothetical protein
MIMTWRIEETGNAKKLRMAIENCKARDLNLSEYLGHIRNLKVLSRNHLFYTTISIVDPKVTSYSYIPGIAHLFPRQPQKNARRHVSHLRVCPKCIANHAHFMPSLTPEMTKNKTLRSKLVKLLRLPAGLLHFLSHYFIKFLPSI